MAETAGYTVEGHLGGAEDGVRVIYDELLARLNALGPVVEDPKKTCIHLNRKSALAGVYVRKGYINLEFKTDYPIESSRIAKSEQVSRSRWHHAIRLNSCADLDDEVMGWLGDAHRLSG